MKKIMFNDKYGLTQAVLEKRKTMTRRIVPQSVLDYYLNEAEDQTIIDGAKYEIGEVVAVAQSYKDAGLGIERDADDGVVLDFGSIHFSTIAPTLLESSGGWNNKMFVRADLMPHHIKITRVKVERLQDISDEDVYKEGFRHEFINNNWGNSAYHEEAIINYYDKKGLSKQIRSRYPKEAFSFLIDKVSRYGTWESNPWVFVYEFELID